MNASGPRQAATARHAFVFVCQAGEIEIKALLLAASLRRSLGADCELIAAVPGPAATWGEPCADTRAQLQAFGARLVAIENPLDPDYRIGNKLACLDVPTRADKIVFLDSDILCLRDFGDPDCLRVPFAAKPADLRTFAAAADVWRPLYAAAGVAMPALSLPTTVTGEFGLPYFNSGVIAVDNGLAFGRAWIDCALAIRDTPPMREQRHWLDQVSLPIAVHRLGLAYAALDERFNFPAHLKPLPGELPFLCHYHWPRIVRREPVLLAQVRELARAHPAIARVASREPEWAALFEPAAGTHAQREPAMLRAAAPVPEQILVTGIPASGADVLLRALDRGACTIAPESAEVSAALAGGGAPWELAAFAQTLHAQSGGGADVVAIGSEVPLLCRLDALGRVLPHARIVACVRNPFDTIAAWKAQPAERFDAALAWVAAAGHAWLSATAWGQFERLSGLADVAEKRAAWWWWLAQRVLERSGEVTIVHYEDLVGDAAAVAHALLDGGAPIRPAATAPAGAGKLDERDRQAIRAICLQAAAELGVAGC